MKPIPFFFRVARIFALGAFLAMSAHAQAQTAPLQSWNEGPAKQAVLEFVKATTDQNGALWVEHPGNTVSI